MQFHSAGQSGHDRSGFCSATPCDCSDAHRLRQLIPLEFLRVDSLGLVPLVLQRRNMLEGYDYS